MTDHNNAEFPELEQMKDALSEIELVVRDYEPKVRELNRKLNDVLGSHPSSPSGAWLYLAKNDAGEYFIALEELQLRDFSKLAWVLGEVADLVDGAPKIAGLIPQSEIDLGPSIVGDAAKLQFLPTTHVRVQRGDK